MEDLENSTALASNVIEPPTHQDPSANEAKDGLDDNAPEPKEEPKVKSNRQALELAAKEVFKKEDKTEEGDGGAKVEKAEPEAKEDTAPKAEKVAEPVKGEAEGEREVKEKRGSEARNYPEPPARFLPKAKEVWRNAPLPVQQEVARLVKDHEAEISQYKQSHEAYEKIRSYDDLAVKSGTDLPTALERYTSMERALREDPAKGFQAIMSNMGISPQQGIASILRAYGIQPAQLAQHIAQNPHEYTALAPQQQQQYQQPQQRQESSDVEELRNELRRMQMEMTAQQIIMPFKADHPRYDELEEDIEFFLKSGKIPMSLSPIERLEAAYDMAERINPSSYAKAAPQFTSDPEPSERRVEPQNLNGLKSVKGAPQGSDNPDPKGRKVSTRQAVMAAAAQIGF